MQAEIDQYKKEYRLINCPHCEKLGVPTLREEIKIMHKSSDLTLKNVWVYECPNCPNARIKLQRAFPDQPISEDDCTVTFMDEEDTEISDRCRQLIIDGKVSE